MTKTLIIYYSRKGENYHDDEVANLSRGNTEQACEILKKYTDADMFEIRTVNEYPESYDECCEVAKTELRENKRPELVEYLDDISQYENIVVAGPCWWGTFPMAIFSQLEKLDFNGKTVYPLMSHEGSGLAGSISAIKKYCPGANVGDGLAIVGADTKNSEDYISLWAKKNLV